MKITGAELFVKALQEEGIKHLFAYPGGQVIDLFDALYGQNEIEVILPRHEQGLIHAADGYARSTGNIGVCLVTSGPGATNLVTGIATANYDSVPLVCFTGQVATDLIGKDAFQEVDIVSITSSICKYAITVRDRKNLGSIIKKAFDIAKTGKPGVVVIDLPKDVQRAIGSDEYPKEAVLPGDECRINCNEEQVEERLEEAVRVLQEARKPLFLVGGGVRIAQAGGEMKELAERTGVPVITTIMGKGAIPTEHPLYVGNIGIHGNYASNNAIQECDVLFAIGVRFNDRITGKISKFASHAKIIHVDIASASISRNIQADIAIIEDAQKAILALLKKISRLEIKGWIQQIHEWKINYPIFIRSEEMNPQHIIEYINQVFHKSIIVTDVGQNQLWTTQFIALDENRRLLTSGGLGTMGYGFPAALGARIGNPDMDVLVITGDGGMQMNIQELATAVVYELPIIICIFNNGYLGNVRQWQEMFFDKRYSNTCLRYRKSCQKDCNQPNKECPKYTPDFVELAESYGAKGIRVEKRCEIEQAFQEARKNRNTPTVIEFIIPREANVLPIVPTGNVLNEMIMED